MGFSSRRRSISKSYRGSTRSRPGSECSPLRQGSSLPRSAAQPFRRVSRPARSCAPACCHDPFDSDASWCDRAQLDNASFLLAMVCLESGWVSISQLGNVAQSLVTDDDRSQAGGLQNTAQQLGSSLARAAWRRRHHRPDHRLYEQHRIRSAGVSRGPAAGRDAIASGQLRFRGRVQTAATDAGAEPEEVEPWLRATRTLSSTR